MIGRCCVARESIGFFSSKRTFVFVGDDEWSLGVRQHDSMNKQGENPYHLCVTFCDTKYSEEEIARIIILTILHTSRQHCHRQLVVHGQNSLRRGNTVHDNELVIR